MFEEVEEFLMNNKIPVPDDGSDIKRKPKKVKVSRQGLGDEIKLALQAKFPGAKIEEITSDEAMAHGMINAKSLLPKFNGLINSIAAVAKANGLAPFCLDAAGRPLKDGDMLICRKDIKKKVLKVGYAFCELSHTDDYTKYDGVWFEQELKDNNFLKE